MLAARHSKKHSEHRFQDDAGGKIRATWRAVPCVGINDEQEFGVQVLNGMRPRTKKARLMTAPARKA